LTLFSSWIEEKHFFWEWLKKNWDQSKQIERTSHLSFVWIFNLKTNFFFFLFKNLVWFLLVPFINHWGEVGKESSFVNEEWKILNFLLIIEGFMIKLFSFNFQEKKRKVWNKWEELNQSFCSHSKRRVRNLLKNQEIIWVRQFKIWRNGWRYFASKNCFDMKKGFWRLQNHKSLFELNKFSYENFSKNYFCFFLWPL